MSGNSFCVQVWVVLISTIATLLQAAIPGRPEFLDGPGHVLKGTRVAYEKGKLELKCKADGTQPILYTWKKDGRPLRRNRYISKGFSLKIIDLVLSDSGNYTCNATNVYGSSLYNYRVYVIGYDESLHSTKSILPGSVAKIPCVLSKRRKNPRRIWWKDGEKVIVDKKRKINNKGILMVKKFERNDEGLYICKLRNGRTVKRVYLLYKEIQGRPVFRDGQSSFLRGTKVALVTGSIKLKCKAEGTQPIRYTWTKNGRPLTHRKYVADGYSMRIDNLVLSDIGNYTCNASNVHGFSLYTYTVAVFEVVRSQPFLQDGYPRNALAHVGENASMECYELFSGKMGTIVDFRWFLWLITPNMTLEEKLHKQVPHENSANNFTLISSSFYEPIQKNHNNKVLYGVRVHLYNVSKKDEGYYSCVACNHLGCAVRTANLTVFEDIELMTSAHPVAGPVHQPQKHDEIIVITVVIVLVAVVAIVVLAFVKYRRLSRETDKKRAQSLNDPYTDANLNKKNYIVKCNGSNDSKFVSITSSSMPLIHKSSLRTGSESHWTSLSHQRSLQQLSLPLNADACLETLEIPLDTRWEIDRENLILGETLGEGAFGVVVKAEALSLPSCPDRVSTVAVKMLKADATEHELHDLLSEMETMKHIGQHRNIINFIGCCTQNGTIYVVVEFAPFGNLRQFLRNNRPSLDSDQSSESSVTMPTLVSFAFQVAKGMEFLADRQCIHRDLAARNVLIGQDHVMKIADFGLARNVREADYYRKRTDGRLPIKWLSIEALFDRVYTTQSDVWAYGVLLWEIFTLGGSPYPCIPVEKLFSLLKSGYRMQKPQGCPFDIYEVMLECWFEEPSNRPSFSSLVNKFEAFLESFSSMDYIEVVADSTDCILEVDETQGSDTAEPSADDSADDEETPLDMLEESTL